MISCRNSGWNLQLKKLLDYNVYLFIPDLLAVSWKINKKLEYALKIINLSLHFPGDGVFRAHVCPEEKV
jgi:hypothetical protein